MFAARLVAYVPGGARLGALPDPLELSGLGAHDDRGSLTVTYSSLAAAGAHVERGLADGLEVALEAWNGTAWVEPRGCRFALLSRDKDAIDPSKTARLTLPSWAWLLGQARILTGPFYGPEHAQAGKRGFEAKTAGEILLTLFNENAARDGVPVTATFTAVNDSEGNPWPVLPNQAFEAGADLGSVLDALTQAGALDWWTQARGLYAVLPDSATAFPTLPATLRAHDIAGAPDTETLEGLLGRLMLRTQAGGTVTVDDPAAPSPFGVWEGFAQAGNVADESAATALAEQTLEGAAKVRGQYTRELVLHDAAPRPFVDYWPGAWITAPVGGASQVVRVQSITLSLSGGVLGGNVVLNDRLMDANLRRARTLAALANGGAISPSGPPAPIAVDPEASRIPSTPTGLDVVAGITFTGPTPRGVVTATWNPVSTATDSGALTISGYELQYRIGAGAWQTIVTPEVSAIIADLTPGDALTARVRATGARTTNPSAWSATDSVTVPGDVTPPPVPTGLSMTSARGMLQIAWDGTPAMPADFARLEIATGATNTPTTVVGSLIRGGTLPVQDTVGAARYMRARTVDTTGNPSAWSAAVGPVTVASVVAADIDAAVNDAIAQALTGPIDGTRVNPWTILPNRVLIGPGDNLHGDPSMQLPAAWENPTWIQDGQGKDGSRALVIPAGATQTGSYFGAAAPGTYAVRVNAGAQLQVYAWVFSPVALAENVARFWVRTVRLDTNATVLNTSVPSPAIPANTWTRIVGSMTVPTTVDNVGVLFGLYKTGTTTDVVKMCLPDVRTRATGELVVDGAITTRALAADAVDASVVKAGSLSADLFTGVLALVSKLVISETQSETGQRVEMDPAGGVRFYTADDQVWIELPTAAGSTPQFRGAIEANGLIVREGATFYSPQNEFARGSKIALAEQVSGPLAGPTPVFTWEGVQLVRTAFTDVLGTFALDPSQICGVGRDLRSGSSRVTIMQKRPGGTRIWYYNMDGTLAPLIVGGEPHPFTDHVDWEITGGIIDDTQNIWLGKWATNNEWYFRKTDGTFSRYPSANPTTRNVMGWNGTDYLVAEKISTTGYRFRRMAPTGTDATVLENVNSTGLGPLTPALAFIYKGNADFGSTKWVVSHQDQNVYRPFTAAGAYDADNRWDPPGQKMGGFWNAGDSRFYTVGADGMLYKHSAMTWTDPVMDTWHVGQSFYDSNATGGTHESALGAITSFTMKKRANVRLSLADVPYSGEVDDPNMWRLYAKRGAAPASNFSDMRLQTSGSYTVHTTVMSSFPTTGGTAALQFGTFADGAPAMLQSARTMPSDPTKRIIEIRGDGSARFGTLEVSNAGVVTDRGGAWTNLTLLNNWTSISGFTAQYLFIGSVLYLRGRVQNTVAGSSTTIADLSAIFAARGFALTQQWTNNGYSSGGGNPVNITTAGLLQSGGGSPPPTTFLYGMVPNG